MLDELIEADIHFDDVFVEENSKKRRFGRVFFIGEGDNIICTEDK